MLTIIFATLLFVFNSAFDTIAKDSLILKNTNIFFKIDSNNA